VPLIGHLVGHDQMVLGVDGGLHVVADDGGAFAAERPFPVKSRLLNASEQAARPVGESRRTQEPLLMLRRDFLKTIGAAGTLAAPPVQERDFCNFD
jgi:hypothetical protein